VKNKCNGIYRDPSNSSSVADVTHQLIELIGSVIANWVGLCWTLSRCINWTEPNWTEVAVV